MTAEGDNRWVGGRCFAVSGTLWSDQQLLDAAGSKRAESSTFLWVSVLGGPSTLSISRHVGRGDNR